MSVMDSPSCVSAHDLLSLIASLTASTIAAVSWSSRRCWKSACLLRANRCRRREPAWRLRTAASWRAVSPALRARSERVFCASPILSAICACQTVSSETVRPESEARISIRWSTLAVRGLTVPAALELCVLPAVPTLRFNAALFHGPEPPVLCCPPLYHFMYTITTLYY